MENNMRYQNTVQAVKAAVKSLDAAAAALENIISNHIQALRAAGYPCPEGFVPTGAWRAWESRDHEGWALVESQRAHGHPHAADYKAAERGRMVLDLRKEADRYRKAAANFRRAPVRVLEAVLAGRGGNGKEAEATCLGLLADSKELLAKAEEALKRPTSVAPLPAGPAAKKEVETRPLARKGDGFKGFGPKPPAPKVVVEVAQAPQAPAVTAAPAPTPAPAKAEKPVLVGKGFAALANL